MHRSRRMLQYEGLPVGGAGLSLEGTHDLLSGESVQSRTFAEDLLAIHRALVHQVRIKSQVASDQL